MKTEGKSTMIIDGLFERMMKRGFRVQHRASDYAEVEVALWEEVMFRSFGSNQAQTRHQNIIKRKISS